ncbi:MAG: hypothetical protein IKD89_00170 [Clostridia bacterium]|nr:hypothetical protein [Clostridia bacterium]
MSALKIKILSPPVKSDSYTCIKKAVRRLCDRNCRFELLPKLRSLYEESREGRIARRMLFSDECDLAAVFFYPDAFDDSARLLLETMEYCPRTVIISDAASGAVFDSGAFADALCIGAASYDLTVQGTLYILDFIRTYAASLLYASPSFINYGEDAECALGMITDGARRAFGAEKKRWAAAMLLRGGAFRDMLKDMLKPDEEALTTLSDDIKRAEAYLDGCTPPLSFGAHAEDIFRGITGALKNASLREEPKEEAEIWPKIGFICAMLLLGLFGIVCALIFSC